MTHKFKTNDTVKFVGDQKLYKVIRVYKAVDGTFKYDITSIDGVTLIIAMPEEVLVLDKKFIKEPV